MNKIAQLITEVSAARNNYLLQTENFTEENSKWKPSPDTWNVTEITEHLFWAEHGGIAGMWKTIHAIRNGQMERSYESVHRDMPVEKIVELTWQPKEIVPAVAAPRMGGALAFWQASLKSLQPVLGAFGNDLKEDELRIIAHPHPISGQMDFQQRLEFLRFHLNRHAEQVSRLLDEMNKTPANK